MINVRRTVESDYATKGPWRAELDLMGTLADAIMPPAGSRDKQVCVVVGYGNSPEHAISECYLAVGKRTCTTLRELATGEVK